MKMTKYLVSSAAAIAVAGTLSLAYAQTTTPAAPVGGNNATDAQRSPDNSGTAATGTLNNQGTRMTNRRADGTMPSNMNADGTSMTTERVARADRG